MGGIYGAFTSVLWDGERNIRIRLVDSDKSGLSHLNYFKVKSEKIIFKIRYLIRILEEKCIIEKFLYRLFIIDLCRN